MKKLLIIIFVLVSPLLLFSEQDELFRTRGNAGLGAGFINSAVNAYGVSTGGILTIFGHTADAVFWNPAGLCQIEDTQVQLNAGVLSYDRMIGSISFAKLIGEDQDKAIGITAYNAYVGGIDSYNEYDDYLKKMEYFGNALIFTYAKPTSMIKLGFNIKILNEIIDKEMSYGGAVDLGVLITPPIPVFLGINIKNLPGFTKSDHDKNIYRMGSGYQFGLGYKTFSDSMKVGLTFSKNHGDEGVNFNLGGEFAVSSLISLRFGFLEGDFSGGVGINLGPLNIDYAYYNESFLDISSSSHLMATTFHF